MAERFELIEQVGRGGMGAVWKARDTHSGGIVALKIPWEQYATDPSFERRFEREVEVMRRIDSPHVAKTIGVGRRDGRPFFAMEFVEGESLRQLLIRRKKLPWEEASEILRQVALGLQAAHDVNVIHRDIKPSNILVGADGVVRLVDFGIARATDMDALTGSVTVMGTVAYMAPEGTPGPAADFYALGCVAFEMLAGEPPFVSESAVGVLVRQIREAPALVRLPLESREIVAWLLRKEPGERPASAADLVFRFEGLDTMRTAKFRPSVMDAVAGVPWDFPLPPPLPPEQPPPPGLPRTITVREALLVEAADDGPDWTLRAYLPVEVSEKDEEGTHYVVRHGGREGFVPIALSSAGWDADADNMAMVQRESQGLSRNPFRTSVAGLSSLLLAVAGAAAWFWGRITEVLPP